MKYLLLNEYVKISFLCKNCKIIFFLNKILIEMFFWNVYGFIYLFKSKSKFLLDKLVKKNKSKSKNLDKLVNKN